MSSIVFASNNLGKIAEIQPLLSNTHFTLLPQQVFNVESIEETGLTFVENAILKARHAAKISGLPSLADDSGLEVDFLQGQPGIYSARYAGEHASDEENTQKLLQTLITVPQEKRNARYRCVLVFMRYELDPTPQIFQGTWEGVITTSPQGDNGFGYDPVFYVPEQQCTAAQLSKEQKAKLSHRGKALRLFSEFVAGGMG